MVGVVQTSAQLEKLKIWKTFEGLEFFLHLILSDVRSSGVKTATLSYQ